MKTTTKLKTIQTSASGTVFVSLADEVCDEVYINNRSGQSLDIRIAPGTTEHVLENGLGRGYSIQKNAKEVSIKRTDDSTSQVTVEYTTIRRNPNNW